MPKVISVIDDIGHRAGLLQELGGKSLVEKTGTMLRETRGQDTEEVLSKMANDALIARVTPQIKKSARIPEEFKAKIEKIKAGRKYSDMEELISETDSIKLLKYIQKHIYIDGKRAPMAEHLKERTEYKILLLKCPEYKTQFFEDRKRFYDFLDKTLNEALNKGKITRRKAYQLSKQYRNSADEKIMYSILSQEDKFVFPNRFDETNSAVLELRLRLIKELKNYS